MEPSVAQVPQAASARVDAESVAKKEEDIPQEPIGSAVKAADIPDMKPGTALQILKGTAQHLAGLGGQVWRNADCKKDEEEDLLPAANIDVEEEEQQSSSSLQGPAGRSSSKRKPTHEEHDIAEHIYNGLPSDLTVVANTFRRSLHTRAVNRRNLFNIKQNLCRRKMGLNSLL